MSFGKWHGINESTGLTYCGKNADGDQCCYVYGVHDYWTVISTSNPKDCCKACTTKINAEKENINETT